MKSQAFSYEEIQTAYQSLQESSQQERVDLLKTHANKQENLHRYLEAYGKENTAHIPAIHSIICLCTILMQKKGVHRKVKSKELELQSAIVIKELQNKETNKAPQLLTAICLKLIGETAPSSLILCLIKSYCTLIEKSCQK